MTTLLVLMGLCYDRVMGLMGLSNDGAMGLCYRTSAKSKSSVFCSSFLYKRTVWNTTDKNAMTTPAATDKMRPLCNRPI